MVTFTFTGISTVDDTALIERDEINLKTVLEIFDDISKSNYKMKIIKKNIIYSLLHIFLNY
jgi:hypothetical protein